jgi:hypothetical protein
MAMYQRMRNLVVCLPKPFRRGQGLLVFVFADFLNPEPRTLNPEALNPWIMPEKQ